MLFPGYLVYYLIRLYLLRYVQEFIYDLDYY